jgi:hypothetical protein
MKATIRLYAANPLAEVHTAARAAAVATGVSLSAALRSVNQIHQSAYLIDPNLAKIRKLRRPGPDLITACVNLLLSLGVEVELQVLHHTEPVIIKSSIAPELWSKLFDKETTLSAAEEIRGGLTNK